MWKYVKRVIMYVYLMSSERKTICWKKLIFFIIQNEKLKKKYEIKNNKRKM